MGMITVCCSENGQFFDKYGHDSSYFFLAKIEKVGHPIDFLDQKYRVILRELTFFDPI